MSLKDLVLILKHLPGQHSQQSHAGDRGGSTPSLNSFNLQFAEGQAYQFTKESNISSEQLRKLTSGQVNAIYNARTKKWIASPSHAHSEIMADALGEKYIYDEDWKHTVKAVILDNKVILYDLSKNVETIAENPRQEKTILNRLEKNMAAAVDNLFKIDGKDVEYSYEPWEFV